MTKKRWMHGAVWAVIAATTLFIWSRSLQSAAVSLEQSGWVNDLLTTLLGDGYADSFWYEYIRKVAHFAEFAVLGIEWGIAWRRLGVPRWIVCVAGPLTAACDELLQLFSVGRSAQITDVLLDCAGYACGIAAVWAVCLVWKKIKKKDGLG